MAGEVVIGAGAISGCATLATATVRVVRLAACDTAGVLSPLELTRVHCIFGAIAAPLTVMVSVAIDEAELVSSAVPDTPALPHVIPDSMNAMLVVLPVKLGSTSAIWSFTVMLNGAVKV
jgi:hypothetical protein